MKEHQRTTKNRLNKTTALVIILCMLVTVLTGCGNQAANNGTGSGDTFDMTFINNADVATLDITYAEAAETLIVVQEISDTLYSYDENGILGLGLAESVTVSEDGLTYTFTIRDTKWSNGAPLTAYDFEYSWKRLANPENGASYAYLLYVAGIKNAYSVCYEGADLDTLGVTATDDRTLVVELDRPVAYFPSVLRAPALGPLNQEYVESQGDQYGLGVEHVISVGPFIASEWEPGTGKIVLTKNPDYYNAENVELDSITYQTITDVQEQIMAWESGQTDEIQLSGDYVQQYENDPAYFNVLAARVAYIAPNTQNPYLANANLRLALALSFDKDAIAENILKDGSVAQNFALPENFAADENGVTIREASGKTYLETDKALAQEYFEKAKEELGTDTFTFELLYDDTESLSDIAQFIKSEIENNLDGVTIELKMQPKNARLELMNSGDFDLGITFWGADYQDGTTFLDLWTTENSYNYGKWSDAEYDELVRAVSGELANDNAARIQNMIQAEEIIMEQAGIIPVYQLGYAYLINADVKVVYTTEGFVYHYTKRAQ